MYDSCELFKSIEGIYAIFMDCILDFDRDRSIFYTELSFPIFLYYSFLSAANVFSFHFVSVKKIKAEILVFINRV